jgi:uncharacterized protein
MDLSAVLSGGTFVGLGAAAGFVGGLASSAHCAAMCGPLACVASGHLVPLGRLQTGAASGADGREIAENVALSRAPTWRASLAYHAARITSYAAVGALLALAGDGAKRALGEIAPVLPWVMAAALVASALGLGRALPAPAFLKNLLGRFARKSAKFSPLARAAALGAATPLLPCAALYAVMLAAAATGSSVAGALLMAAFALGATPALAVMQFHAPLLRRHPRLALAAGRAFPLLAAAVLVWRALHAGAPTCH